MNTRQLQHFLALLDEGSLSAAAETVHLSQPALSRSIRALEDNLGVPLFDRNDRRLRPTPYARSYEERARRIVFDAREGARALALMRDGESGQMSFGMGSSLTPFLMAPMLLELMVQSPSLTLHSVTANSDRLLAALQEESIDFFVGDVRVANGAAGITVTPVYATPVSWFVRAGHPLASERRIEIDTLRAYPWIGIGYPEESIMQRFAQLYDLPAPVREKFAVTVDDVNVSHLLVTGSDSILPATDLSMIELLRQGKVVRIEVSPEPDIKVMLGIMHHAERTLMPAAYRAFEIIKRQFLAIRAEINRQRNVQAG